MADSAGRGIVYRRTMAHKTIPQTSMALLLPKQWSCTAVNQLVALIFHTGYIKPKQSQKHCPAAVETQ